ncbi:class I SAM-dependent methyltransferase [Pelagibius sp.]|uniref:class I SAM-dependent methyltransferase n=1 Tax=Pelagibius sp. TaxID=1931238 RepID=UPI002602FB7B|nr:class I SAM-dependent methyltransferase [Pelagibius sp.]
MWHDVVDLREFYETRRGQVARHMVRRAVRSVWPDVTGQRVLGLGFATPYLRQFRSEAERVLAFMPASQGVLHWPPEGPGVVSLVEETELPLPDYSVDRVLLAHGLENSEALRALLREIWRVLTGDGRLLVVVPNRRGIWARSDRTPLGWGHPYSAAQLSRLLRENMFTPTRTERALYVPPTTSHTLLRSAPAFERIGARFFPTFAGVVMIESGKQLYAGSVKRVRGRIGKPVVVQLPQAAGRVHRERTPKPT